MNAFNVTPGLRFAFFERRDGGAQLFAEPRSVCRPSGVLNVWQCASALGFALVFCLLNQGCAHQPAPQLVSTQAEQNLSPISLEFSGTAPSLTVSQTPTNKVKAGATTAFAAAGTVAQGGGGSGYAVIGALILMPVAAVGGGVYGVVQGVSERDLRNGKAAFETARTDLDLQESLAASLLAAVAATSDRGIHLTYSRAQANTDHTDLAPSIGDAADNGATLANEKSSTPEVAANARLQLRVLQCRLAGNPAINPPLRLLILLEGDLIRSADGSNVGKLYLRFESKPRKYMEWADDNAAALRKEWQTASSLLATQVLDWLAGTVPPPFSIL